MKDLMIQGVELRGNLMVLGSSTIFSQGTHPAGSRISCDQAGTWNR